MYGTYEWKVPITIDPVQCPRIPSQFFHLCAHTWKVCVERTYQHEQHYLGCYLACAGIPPKEVVTYQLWVRSENKSKSASFATRTTKFAVAELPKGTRSLLPWAILVDSTLGYLKDQCVTLGIHIHVQAEVSQRVIRNPLQQLTAFSQHYNDPLLSDVIFEANGLHIHVHKVVLVAHSASFKAMFESEIRDAHSPVVKMGQISASVFEAMIQSMYGKLERIKNNILLPLLVAADAHQVDVLRQRCIDQTLHRLSPSTILGSASVADQLGDQPLLDACLEYWANLPNTAEIVKSSEMADLMRDNTALAQELLATVMDHPAKKARTA